MSSVQIVDYFSLDSELQYNQAQSLFCSPSWIKILRITYGYEFYTALDEVNNKKIHFSVIDNILGKKVSSLPFSDYTDIELENESNDYDAIIRKIKHDYPDTSLILKAQGKASANGEFANAEISRSAYLHRINTEEGKIVKSNQSSSFKRNVKSARKNEITIAQKRDRESLLVFYRLYHALRLEKFKSIPQPLVFFQNIFEEFIAKKQGFILEAIYKNEVIASIIVLQHKNILFYKFGASAKDHLELRPNNLLFNELITFAKDNKIASIDLGLSGAGESYQGLVRFKESMGGVATDLNYYEFKSGSHQSIDGRVKKWIHSLTGEMVDSNLGVKETSKLSELIYPLFG